PKRTGTVVCSHLLVAAILHCFLKVEKAGSGHRRRKRFLPGWNPGPQRLESLGPMPLIEPPPGKHAVETGTMQKVTLRIVPFLMVCYFVSFLDRVNLGFAALEMVK